MISIDKQFEFLVGIDSDGCVFDTMELKHKECFIPNLIRCFDLQGISKYAREAAEFVNLYSKSRGINRFPALLEELHWVERRPEVQARGVAIARLPGVARWIESESKLGNPALEKAVKQTGDQDLQRALDWSRAVNQSVADMVRGVPPFPYVRSCLEALSGKADMVVASATPTAALESEWREHGLATFVRKICGQEAGSKTEILAVAAQYPQGQALMVGDAPGDYKAAKANGCRFFPVNPGAEEASWQRLLEEAIPRFLDGAFSDDYQRELLDEFDTYLPEKPPWPVVDEATGNRRA